MATLYGVKRAGMGKIKLPSAVKKKRATAAKKSSGGKRKINPSLWGKRKKKYAWQAGEGQIVQKISKYRQKHNSLSKSAKPALPAKLRQYAKKYFNATRKNSKMKLYDKVRGKFYRKTLKNKYGTTRTSFYNEGNKAGRRPRKGSRTRTYKKAGKPGRPKKAAAKKSMKKTSTKKKPGRPAGKKRGPGRPKKKK